MIILYTALVALVLAFVLGFLLGFFKKVFYVKTDPRQEQIRSVLPGANCGGCGFPGCDGFAAACAKGKVPVDGCTAGGAATAKQVAAVMGVTAAVEEKIALLACRGSKEHTQVKGDYIGVKTCVAAKQSINGTKLCNWGCIGFGDCVSVCGFGALSMGDDGLPHIDAARCTGCGVCVKACPQQLLSRVPVTRKGAVALCANRTQNKASVLKNCKVGCIKCGKCERLCPKKAIVITNGIPVVDYALCDACGECVNGCPTKVLALLPLA